MNTFTSLVKIYLDLFSWYIWLSCVSFQLPEIRVYTKRCDAYDLTYDIKIQFVILIEMIINYKMLQHKINYMYGRSVLISEWNHQKTFMELHFRLIY